MTWLPEFMFIPWLVFVCLCLLFAVSEHRRMLPSPSLLPPAQTRHSILVALTEPINKIGPGILHELDDF